MHPDADPQFGVHSHEAAMELLQRNHVGRLAFTHHDRVDIEPISYVNEGDWIYLRTSPGAKTGTLRHHPWVAFEVDEVHGPNHWDSAVVRGTIYWLSSEGSAVEQAVYQHALTILRRLDAHALTPQDATPHRTELLRIHVNEVSARSARPTIISPNE